MDPTSALRSAGRALHDLAYYIQTSGSLQAGVYYAETYHQWDKHVFDAQDQLGVAGLVIANMDVSLADDILKRVEVVKDILEDLCPLRRYVHERQSIAENRVERLSLGGRMLEREAVAMALLRLVTRGESAQNRFPASWYTSHTAHGLYADLLRQANRRGQIQGEKVGARWHYELDSVCHKYPEYADKLMLAAGSVTNRNET